MQQRNLAVGSVIAAIILAILAILAFTQQQQAANNEATAIALAEEAEAARDTAVFDANTRSTAQAEAQAAEGTAIAQSNAALTAQAEAESAQVEAEATAEAQAATAAAALNEAAEAQAEATEQAGVALAAQAEATEQAEAAMAAQTQAAEQEATAQALTGLLADAAELQATQESIGTASALDQALAASNFSTAEAAWATTEAELEGLLASAQDESGNISLTATAHVQATGTALAQAEATVFAFLTQAAVEPTPVPGEPEPTDPPIVDSGVPALTQQYTNSLRDLTVSYPNGWLVDESSSGQQLILASSSRAIANFPETPAGEMAIFIRAVEITADIQDVSPQAVVTVFGEDLQETLRDTVTFRLSPPDTFQVNGLSSSRSFSGTDMFDLEVVVIRKRNAFIVAFGFCAPGEGVACEDTLLAIAGAAEYSG